MPQVNLTAVTGQELRQLLDSSRRRGDAALTYTILQEMAARREAAVERRPFRMRRPGEPRLVAVELDEPEEADDLPPMPHWRPPEPEPARVEAAPPAQEKAPDERRSRRKASPTLAVVPAAAQPVAAIDADAPPSPDSERPLSLRDADPAPWPDEAEEDLGLRLGPDDAKRAPVPRRPRFRMVAGFALGLPAGIALGWLAAGFAPSLLAPPAADPIRTAALAPPTVPVATPRVMAVETALAPEAPLDAPAEPPLAEAEQVAAEPERAVIEPTPQVAEPEDDRAAEVAQDRSGLAVAGGCAGEPTPADREICGDAQLRRLQGELRRTYSEALEAHEERALLRQRQLAWREARNTVSDPDRLARLYEDRIRKLKAATAAAREAR